MESAIIASRHVLVTSVEQRARKSMLMPVFSLDTVNLQKKKAHGKEHNPHKSQDVSASCKSTFCQLKKASVRLKGLSILCELCSFLYSTFFRSPSFPFPPPLPFVIYNTSAFYSVVWLSYISLHYAKQLLSWFQKLSGNMCTIFNVWWSK